MPIRLHKFRFTLKAAKIWKDFNKSIMCVLKGYTKSCLKRGIEGVKKPTKRLFWLSRKEISVETFKSGSVLGKHSYI